TVLETNSNAVEYKDGKLVITDQYDESPKKITFSKVNLGGEEIAGAKIQIFDEQKNQVAEWTSEAGKSKIIDLKPGKYVFHEEAAPNGYLAVTDITFQVNYDGTITVTNIGEKDAKGESNTVVTDGAKITITDKTDDLPRKITFSKVNLGGEEIAGAKIQIFDEQKNKVAEWTSEAGKSKIIDLKPGKYVFHEEAAPNGYLAVTDITFQVNYDGTVTVLDTNSNAVEYKDGKLVITDQYAPTTTTETPNPPSPGKKRKALPKTGEESGLTTTLIGFTLLVVVGAASVLYRKSKESE
ncbi:MAG: SpaA isopeptide-forming pilin-related protein, partial [Streptococcus minor]|nr:SpaA isopeptide-forming pilin-related protein [Streptococcus minor]